LLTLEVRFEEPETLGSRGEFLKRLAVGYVLDVLANRLNKHIRLTLAEELRNRIQQAHEIVQRLEMNPSRVVACAHFMYKIFTLAHNGLGMCADIVH
jgi:hypothetical protein